MSKRKHQALYALLMVFCLLLGFVFSVQYRSGPQTRLLVGQSSAELRENLAKLEDENQKLMQNIEAQRRQIQDLLSAQEGVDTRESVLRHELLRVETFAGLIEVEGPGAIVTCEDSTEARIRASELLFLLNEFRAAGAQGIAINNQRIVAMSEMRSVGPEGADIVVNGERISQHGHYEIRIIGNPQSLENAWSMLAEFRRSLGMRNLNLEISYPDRVKLPALPKSSPAYRIGSLNATQTNGAN